MELQSWCGSRVYSRCSDWWLLVLGHWWLVLGHWWLVLGHWWLVLGHWSVGAWVSRLRSAACTARQVVEAAGGCCFGCGCCNGAPSCVARVAHGPAAAGLTSPETAALMLPRLYAALMLP
jgi:hypothetical protein